MKLSKSQQDTGTAHEFELAGKKLRISFDRWNWDEGVINAVVQVENPEVPPDDASGFNIGGLHVYSTKEDVKETNDWRTSALVDWGSTIPMVKFGEVDDKGEAEVGDVPELCAALGLNPHDSAHYHEVSLAVRAASLTLARKLAEKRRVLDGRGRKDAVRKHGRSALDSSRAGC